LKTQLGQNYSKDGVDCLNTHDNKAAFSADESNMHPYLNNKVWRTTDGTTGKELDINQVYSDLKVEDSEKDSFCNKKVESPPLLSSQI